MLPRKQPVPAADPSARVVPFTTVETIGDDPQFAPVSCSDEDTPGEYRPSVCYFRRSLNEAPTLKRAATVAVVVAAEFEQLQLWAIEQGVLPMAYHASAAECLRNAIRQSTSRSQAILLGQFLCHELEQLKAAVCAAGMTPPKWIVDPDEAREKGWEVRHA